MQHLNRHGSVRQGGLRRLIELLGDEGRGTGSLHLDVLDEPAGRGSRSPGERERGCGRAARRVDHERCLTLRVGLKPITLRLTVACCQVTTSATFVPDAGAGTYS